MNRIQILQEIERLHGEIRNIKNDPSAPQEHSILINTVMQSIKEFEQKLAELGKTKG